MKLGPAEHLEAHNVASRLLLMQGTPLRAAAGPLPLGGAALLLHCCRAARSHRSGDSSVRSISSPSSHLRVWTRCVRAGASVAEASRGRAGRGALRAACSGRRSGLARAVCGTPAVGGAARSVRVSHPLTCSSMVPRCGCDSRALRLRPGAGAGRHERAGSAAGRQSGLATGWRQRARRQLRAQHRDCQPAVPDSLRGRT